MTHDHMVPGSEAFSYRTLHTSLIVRAAKTPVFRPEEVVTGKERPKWRADVSE